MSDNTVGAENHHARTMPSLPPEILSTIFMVLAQICPAFEYYQGTRNDYFKRGWLVATQVCHSWRVIAIGHKSLWSRIATVHPQFFQLFVERSRPLPLSICTRETYRSHAEMEKYVALVMDQLINTWCLDISTSSSLRTDVPLNAQPLIFALNETTHDLPIQALDLSWFSSEPEDPTLLPHFFLHAPHLQELKLWNVHFSLLAPHFKIRFLELRAGDFDATDVLQVLRFLPSLESLELEHIDGSDAIEATEPIAILSKLQYIVILAKGFEFANTSLLKHIQAHPQADMRVSTVEFDFESNPCEHTVFMESLSSYAERHALTGPVSVNINFVPWDLDRDDRHFIDENFMEVSVCSVNAVDEGTDICLPTQTLPASQNFGFSVFVELAGIVSNPAYQLLSLPTLRHASWTSFEIRDPGFSIAHFVGVFKSAMNIEDLTLENLDCKPLLDFFAYLNADALLRTTYSLPDPLLLPKLSKLTLKGRASDCRNQTRPALQALTVMVESTLSNRKLAGHPIKDLHLQECGKVFELMHVMDWTKFGCTIHRDGSAGADASRDDNEDVEPDEKGAESSGEVDESLHNPAV